MRVLGLDPGTATTGYGIVDGRGSRLTHIAHGAIRTPANAPFAGRLALIYDGVRELLSAHAPDLVAIEKIFFKQNVTTGIAVAQARGVLALAVVQSRVPIAEFSPAEAKTAITGYGRADKRQMQDMIKMLLNLDATPKPDDAADALGLAICGVHAGNLPSAAEG